MKKRLLFLSVCMALASSMGAQVKKNVNTDLILTVIR